MSSSHGGQHQGRWLAPVVTAVLVAASIGIATPARAARPDGGTAGHSGRTHAAATSHGRHHAHPAHPRHAAGSTAAPSGGQGGSAVSLSRPNDFQAQSDPDGMANGGVDQPGGTGGIDPAAQDGNNGSGNDADCEDDNRGKGLPGHCRADQATPPAGEGIPPETDLPSDGTVAPPLVSAPAPDAAGVASTVIARAPAPAAREPGSSVLPETGAGQALPALALAALAALVLGGGLVRQGRRRATTAP